MKGENHTRHPVGKCAIVHKEKSSLVTGEIYIVTGNNNPINQVVRVSYTKNLGDTSPSSRKLEAMCGRESKLYNKCMKHSAILTEVRGAMYGLEVW